MENKLKCSGPNVHEKSDVADSKDTIPILEEKNASNSSLSSYISSATGYMSDFFSSFLNVNEKDGEKKKDDDDDEEEKGSCRKKKSALEAMKEGSKNIFTMKTMLMLSLLFFVATIFYLYREGHFNALKTLVPAGFLAGHGAHHVCTCKHKAAQAVGNAAKAVGGCACQRAKQMAEAAARAAANASNNAAVGAEAVRAGVGAEAV
ncbi:uncharacterized protein PMUG01_11015900 [Plasmodium malariae]|nr:uncharacterized protein PMUG01_11015900 [Plasmodium malariae]SCO92913.1 hypothetical protein PMUG01_11015900 [Plasmodium malariae]